MVNGLPKSGRRRARGGCDVTDAICQILRARHPCGAGLFCVLVHSDKRLDGERRRRFGATPLIGVAMTTYTLFWTSALDTIASSGLYRDDAFHRLLAVARVSYRARRRHGLTWLELSCLAGNYTMSTMPRLQSRKIDNEAAKAEIIAEVFARDWNDWAVWPDPVWRRVVAYRQSQRVLADEAREARSIMAFVEADGPATAQSDMFGES